MRAFALLQLVKKLRNLAGLVFHRTSTDKTMGMPLLYH
jgi:hypothetical protein